MEHTATFAFLSRSRIFAIIRIRKQICAMALL